MSGRTWISLGLCALGLLLPSAAQAASARVRVLNAAPSGTVTFRVDSVARATRLGVRRESVRFSLRPGPHTFTAVRGSRTVARRAIVVSSGERLTVAYAVNRAGRGELRLLREPAPTAGAAQLWVANYAATAGAVDVRAGALAVATGLRYGLTTATRMEPGSSSTGLAAVTARTALGAVSTGTQPLVLATRSVGIFVLVPRGRSPQLLRLAYDTPPPSPTRQPAVTGTRRFGNVVRCERDTWTPKGATVRRQWSVDGVAAGTSAALALTTAAHAGRTIGCAVTATANGMATTVRTSFALSPAPRLLTTPFVEFPGGTLGPGDIATCNTGTWSVPAPELAIRWIRIGSGEVIGTGPTYTLHLPDDNGITQSLGCDVVAATDGGASPRVRSINTIALGIAPTVAIILPSRPPDPTATDAFFDWAIGGGGADSVECSLDGAPFVDCIGQFAQTYHLPAPGPDGADHTFAVRVTNVVATATDTWKWTILPKPPILTLGTPVPREPTDTTASFSWTLGGGAATVACDLDGAAVPCAATGVTLDTPATDADGDSHTLTVTATNVNPTTPTDSGAYTWKVLPPAPLVTNVAVTPGDQSPAGPIELTFDVIGFTKEVTCTLDTVPISCTDTLPEPGVGIHTITVTATNVTGSDTQSVTWEFL